MRILSLDLSTHTGWALFDSETRQLLDRGLIEMDLLPEQVKGIQYPVNYVVSIDRFVTRIWEQVIQPNRPDELVIEETSPGREVYSQKIIESIHFSLVRLILETCKIPMRYVRTGAWRKAVELRMTKADLKGNQKKNIQKAKKIARDLRNQLKSLGNKKANRPQVESIKRQIAALQLGKVTKKHLSVRKVNEIFGLDLKLKDNDTADAILVGLGFLNGAPICDGRRPSKVKN